MIVDLMDLLDDKYRRINTKQQDLFTKHLEEKS